MRLETTGDLSNPKLGSPNR